MKTVVVGMSGGVDSSVAALLLKQQGYNVIGLFMNNWEEQDEGVCTAEQDFLDVRRVCDRIGIGYYSVNFAAQYMEEVFSDFVAAYNAGRTPNPDVLCNRYIKFGKFANYAMHMGADYIATGHYADLEKNKEGIFLKKAKDESKCQTYFLNQVKTNDFSNVIFPLGGLLKSDVRRIAAENNLQTATKKDSTGICFIGERNFRDFLKKYCPVKNGNIVDLAGKTVGQHIGLNFYTIGQRRGLGIGGTKDDIDGRWFVVRKEKETNTLVVSHGDESCLLSKTLTATKVNWIGKTPANDFNCTAKVRYRQPEQEAFVTLNNDNSIKVTFNQPQRAVTEGQYVVFYDGDICLGGGEIDKVK